MKLSSKTLLSIVAVLLIAAPLTVIITLLLYPLWSWLDVIAGVESLGHSGPAKWCYEVVYLVLVVVGTRYVFKKNMAAQ
ncbi:MAG: hypothetical protein V4628_14340 [Pseudomonadota bacterium]